MEKTYVGDVGTAIVLECGQDVSSAYQCTIAAKSPTGQTYTWSAWLSGTTAVRYDTQEGTLDVPGEWLLQAIVWTPIGKWSGETVPLPVYPPFE